MSHSSKIKDADAFFEVDAITRQIINKTPQKITLIQYDHNSERFTFALPRHIEGHDMAESAKAEVHFINIETGGANTHKDKYEMKDLKIDDADESKVICTWLISNNATQYAGRLAFMIRFACLDDNNNYVYVWNTATNEEISITNGMDNGAAMVENYPDILAQWRQDVLGKTSYLTDYFKQLPEGKTINDLDDAYEHGGVYLLSKNNSQTGRSDTLEVTGGWYYDEEFGGDLATTFQIKTEHNGFEYSIMQRYWKDGKWSNWQDVFATPQYVAERIAQIPTGGGSEWTKIGEVTMGGTFEKISSYENGVITFENFVPDTSMRYVISNADGTKNTVSCFFVKTDNEGEYTLKNLDGVVTSPTIDITTNFVQNCEATKLTILNQNKYERYKVRVSSPLFLSHGYRATYTFTNFQSFNPSAALYNTNIAASGYRAIYEAYSYKTSDEESYIKKEFTSAKPYTNNEVARTTVDMTTIGNWNLTHNNGLLTIGTHFELWGAN